MTSQRRPPPKFVTWEPIRRLKQGGKTSVAVIYRFRARDGKAVELLTLLQGGRDFSLTVDGCEGFDVYQGRDDPHQFVMMETWRSEQVHEAHFEKNARGSGWLEQVEALMTQPFESLHASRFVRR